MDALFIYYGINEITSKMVEVSNLYEYMQGNGRYKNILPLHYSKTNFSNVFLHNLSQIIIFSLLIPSPFYINFLKNIKYTIMN